MQKSKEDFSILAAFINLIASFGGDVLGASIGALPAGIIGDMEGNLLNTDVNSLHISSIISSKSLQHFLTNRSQKIIRIKTSNNKTVICFIDFFILFSPL